MRGGDWAAMAALALSAAALTAALLANRRANLSMSVAEKDAKMMAAAIKEVQELRRDGVPLSFRWRQKKHGDDAKK